MDRRHALQLAMAVMLLGLVGADAKAADQKMVVKASDAHPEGYAVGRVTIEQVAREIWLFYGVMFFVLMLVTYIPSVSLWLPRMLGL